MDTRKPTDTAATVIIGQKVRAGSEQAFEAWQQDMNSRGLEVPRIPRRRDQPADRRAARLGGGLPLRLGRPRAGLDQQRHPPGATRRGRSSTSTARAPSRSIGGGARPTDPLVTVVVTHRVEPGERRRLPRLAGPTSAGGEQVRRVPRHRAVPPRRGRPGGVDHAVPLRQRRRSRHVADLRRAPGASRRGREVLRLPVRAPSTTRSAAGSPSTSTATRRRHRRTPRPPSRCGSACTRRWCC